MARPNKEQRELLKEPRHDMRWMVRYIMASDAYKNGTLPIIDSDDTDTDFDFGLDMDFDTGWFDK